MSYILLDYEFPNTKVFKQLGTLFDNKDLAYSFRPPKKDKPPKQAFWCSRNFHRILWNSGCLDYIQGFPNILPRDVKDE